MWETIIWVIFALLVGLGGAVMSINPPEYMVTRWCFLLASLVFLGRIGWWIAVEYQNNRIQMAIAGAVIFGFVGFLTVASLQWVNQRELKSGEGWLYPANDELPPIIKEDDLKENTLLVFLGGIVGGGNEFPHTVLEVKGRKIIVLDRNPDGLIGVSVDIYGADNRIIASIEKGRFKVNQKNIFELERVDRSSLRITDEYNKEVLNIRFFNKNALWINAELYYPGIQHPIIIRGSDLKQANIVSLYNKGADIAFE